MESTAASVSDGRARGRSNASAYISWLVALPCLLIVQLFMWMHACTAFALADDFRPKRELLEHGPTAVVPPPPVATTFYPPIIPQ